MIHEESAASVQGKWSCFSPRKVTGNWGIWVLEETAQTEVESITLWPFSRGIKWMSSRNILMYHFFLNFLKWTYKRIVVIFCQFWKANFWILATSSNWLAHTVLSEGAMKDAGAELSSNVHSAVNPVFYTTSWPVKKYPLVQPWQASNGVANCFLIWIWGPFHNEESLSGTVNLVNSLGLERS